MPLEVARGGGNNVLAALSPAVIRRLDIQVQRVRTRATLFHAFEDQQDVYFPHGSAVLSLIRSTDEGPQVEVAIVGCEGFADATAMVMPATNGTTAVVQIAGEVSRIAARRLRAEFVDDLAVRTTLIGYLALFVEHMTQNAVCNRVHSIEQRLSKWLLIMHDRVVNDHVTVSHDTLSKMLGIQRSGVTLAVGALTDAGFLSHSRKHIAVINADGLGERACECFALMRDKTNAYKTRLASGRAGTPWH
jgi:CRP-like cAMP-binding protein